MKTTITTTTNTTAMTKPSTDHAHTSDTECSEMDIEPEPCDNHRAVWSWWKVNSHHDHTNNTNKTQQRRRARSRTEPSKRKTRRRRRAMLVRSRSPQLRPWRVLSRMRATKTNGSSTTSHEDIVMGTAPRMMIPATPCFCTKKIESILRCALGQEVEFPEFDAPPEHLRWKNSLDAICESE